MTRPTNPALVEKEARLQEAVAAILSGKHTGHSAAIAFDVPRQTLYDRLEGKPPRNQAHEADQLFSHAEETEFVRWITCFTIAATLLATRLCTNWHKKSANGVPAESMKTECNWLNMTISVNIGSGGSCHVILNLKVLLHDLLTQFESNM
jgi:hypothetical protein